MTDQLYGAPDLVSVYDLVNPLGPEADSFEALAGAAPKRILDVGCGTGRLASRLAGLGHHVTGAEPAVLMLEQARRRPGGKQVSWVCSDAASLSVPTRFDLILLAGHVFQVFLGDDEARDVLGNLRAHLARDGRIAFATRNPAAHEWEQWTEDLSLETVVTPTLGAVTVYWDVSAIEGTLITYTTNLSLPDGTIRRGQDTIRFRSQGAIEQLLSDSGLVAAAWYGDWSGAALTATQLEIIVVAHSAP